jgi:hypothetical protein
MFYGFPHFSKLILKIKIYYDIRGEILELSAIVDLNRKYLIVNSSRNHAQKKP